MSSLLRLINLMQPLWKKKIKKKIKFFVFVYIYSSQH